MRYRLRTLLILLAVVPPAAALAFWEWKEYEAGRAGKWSDLETGVITWCILTMALSFTFMLLWSAEDRTPPVPD